MERERVILLGTGPATRGGISAVLRAYREQRLFVRWPVQAFATHCDGSALHKLAAMASGLGAFALALARDRRAIVHVHSASHASFWRKSVFVSLALLAGCPVLFHLHGGGFATFYDQCGPARRWLIRWLLGRAARVVTPSQSLRRRLQSLLPRKRVVCVPNPVLDMPLLPGRARQAMILYLGRIERRKGIYDLLHAVSALRLQMPEATLVCAGDGDVQPFLRHCERLGIADAVTFTGWIGEAEKRALLQRAALFVLPSYVEAMPMSLLEAMSARLPVIATSVGGIPEVITDGVDGFLFRPGDVPALHRLLCKLMHQPALAARVACEARRSVMRRFAAERVVAQLGSLYAELGVRRAVAAVAPLRVRTSRGTA